jgi:linoleoyl-CoA desaturase
LHHPATNVIGTDEFADVSPFFLRTREQLPAGPRLLRFYYLNLQVPALFLVLLAGGFNAQRVGWMHLYTGLRNTRTRNWKNWVDLVALVLHYVCFLAIPALLFDAALVFEIYLVRLLCAGYGVFAVLAPGHYPPEAVCLEGLPRDASSAEHVTATTINIRTGPLGRLLCSGGDYHIEHHLFPNISFVFYPQMSERLRAYCRRNGLAYRSYRWDVALLKCLATFRRPPAITRAAEFGEVSRRLGSVP